MRSACRPTSDESFGNAAVEAMGVGVPTVVFSDSPGLVEHIEPGETGLVVGDSRAGRALDALMDDPALRRRIGAEGSEAVRKRYTPGAAAARYRRLYARLVPQMTPTEDDEAAARFAVDIHVLGVDAVCGEVVTALREGRHSLDPAQGPIVRGLAVPRRDAAVVQRR